MTHQPSPIHRVETPNVTLLGAMIAAPLIAVSARWPRVLHAADMETICQAWPDGTVTAPCGATRLRLYAGGNGYPLPWPPRVRGLEPHTRCRECWTLTGRPRPRCSQRPPEETP